MKAFLRFSLLLAISLAVFACEPPPNGQGGQTGQPALPNINIDDKTIGNLVDGFNELSQEFTEMNRPAQCQAWVENLIIKAQPGKDMPQVGTLKEGEVVEYLYQRTVRKTEFKLRGQRFVEPWILIKTKDGLMGWVHEGGVRFVEANFLELLLGPVANPNANQRTRGPQAVSNDASNHLIVPGKSVGPIKLTTSETELISIYGPGNVSRGSVTKPGGGQEACTIVGTGTAAEIRITWKSDQRDRIKAVYFLQPKSPWYTQQGLHVGMPWLDLIKSNQAPVSFYGFDWDYSGTISSWRGGKMARYEKYFYVVLQPQQAPEVLMRKFQGNQVFTTNAEGVPGLNLAVQQIVVYLD